VTLRQQIKDKHSFGATLALIIISMIVISIPVQRDIGLFLRVVAAGAVVWSVLVASQSTRRVAAIAIGLFLAALVLTVLGAASDSWNLAGFADSCLVVLTALMITAVIRNLATHMRVSLRTVAGALCVYLLIGFFFAGIYAAMSGFGWESLSVTPLHYWDALYFSYVTQLTIGYGDIVPVGQVAKMIAVLEGFTGQIYIVTVIAMLITNIGRDRPQKGFLKAQEDADAVSDAAAAATDVAAADGADQAGDS
jgi:hypothetical protein